jgi:hypothetical protein
MRKLRESDDAIVLTVTLAAEKYAPIQYQSFDVGPFVVQMVVRPEESISDAYERVMVELRALAAKEFAERLAEHLARVRTAASTARGGMGGR